ncbi:MAG: hypothetical protein JWO06_1159 [Bacteroidota bacterium]|nr:hypothetical protein [Bacteroidota bacterium]
MNRLINTLALSLYIAALVAAMSFSKPVAKCKLSIQFKNYVGNELLKLDSGAYKNEAGQLYTVSKFKYYIGHIQLKKADGTEYVSKEYFLLNEDEESTKQLTLSDVPPGDYKEISFLLGVDSLSNCSGAQSGALDPVNGMFWAWNTGYIFLKMEGSSPVSTSPGHFLEFHIGGYKEPNNCIRKISLPLKAGIKIAEEKPNALIIKTDIAEVFRSPVTVDFSKYSSVTDFHNAGMIADNYSDMFSILSVAP